jgi:hypothetical protein
VRIIFSRKGFDSGSGGSPSPIIDGKPNGEFERLRADYHLEADEFRKDTPNRVTRDRSYSRP